MAAGSSAGSSSRRCFWSGWRANQSTMHDSDAATVSRPASTSRNVMSMTSSRVSVSPSTSAVMNPPMRSSPGIAARFPTVELGVEVLDHLRVGGDAVVVVVGTDDPVLEPDEEVEVVERQAEQGEEHHRRQRLAERVVELDLAVGDEAVDELVGQRPHARRELRDDLRREQRVEELAVLRVRVAVEHERDERSARAHVGARELDHVGIHRVDVAALGDLEHVVEVEDRHLAALAAVRRAPVRAARAARAGCREPRAGTPRGRTRSFRLLRPWLQCRAPTSTT